MLSSNNKSDEVVAINYYDNNRDDRSVRFFGEEKFQKLQNARILVVGAGAIGNEVVKNLALLGVKHIYLVDFDMVNKSNINRCIFFRENDHNLVKKVDAVKKRVAEFSPMYVETFDCRIEEAPEKVWDVDMVIIGVDNDYARYLINAKLASSNVLIPVVNGAMGKTFIECEVLVPGETACLTCLWQESHLKQILTTEVKKSCDEYFIEVLPKFPAISTFTSVVGGMMVAEATKILTKDKALDDLGYLIRYDIEKYEYSMGKVMRNPRCVEIMCKKNYVDYKKKMTSLKRYE